MTDLHAVIDGVLQSGHAVSFTAAGDSMFPAIRSGERLIVEAVDPCDLCRGDIVLARLERGLTAHRVVRIVKSAGEVASIVTRGDNCAEDDPPFSAAQLVGRVREPRKSYKIIIRLRHWVRRALR
jgi:signal peptidase I